MICILTGQETNFKFKNIPMTREVYERAKDIRDNSKMVGFTLKHALAELAKALDRIEREATIAKEMTNEKN